MKIISSSCSRFVKQLLTSYSFCPIKVQTSESWPFNSIFWVVQWCSNLNQLLSLRWRHIAEGKTVVQQHKRFFLLCSRGRDSGGFPSRNQPQKSNGIGFLSSFTSDETKQKKKNRNKSPTIDSTDQSVSQVYKNLETLIEYDYCVNLSRFSRNFAKLSRE